MFLALPAALSAQATQLVVTTTVSDTQANATIATITVEARDAGNVLDAAYNSTLSVSITSGTGTLSGTTSSVAMTNGVATFGDLSIDAVGSKVLTFTDGSLTDGVSNAFNITADRLVFTTQPANTTAGQTMANVVVEARDGLGTTDTNFAGSVDIAIASGTGTLNGTASVGATAGVATFSTLSINEADTFTFGASSTGLTGATSNTFDITPDVDAAVVFVQQPTNATVSQAISPAITVQFQDQFGNNTSSTSQVTLTIGNNPGSANLGGTTMVAAVAGVATFNDITLDAAGTGYTLNADSGALTGDTSTAFDITANPAPVITVNGGGGPITNGGTLNVIQNSTVAAANIQITVNDSSTGDSVTLTAGITNVGTTGIVQAEFEGNATSPTAINANPATGTFNALTTHAVTLTANDGVNTAVVFTFDIVVGAAPTITVNSPNGGENFTVGGNMNVTWSSSGVTGNVDILLSTNSGGTFPVTLASSTANDGSETIVVPNNPGTTCRVRVRDTNTGTILDDSNADFTIAVPAPAAVTMSAQGNPGSGTASPGSTRTVLGFRLTETGGASTFTVTSVTVRVNLINNTGNAAANAISSISLRRGSTVLGTQTSATWNLVGNVITLNFTGLSSNVTASSNADFTLAISFSAAGVPTPNPGYQADITPADVNGGTSVSGASVTGGTITLAEDLPDDPFDDDDDDEDSCNLSTRGGPAWPMLFVGLLIGAAALRRRRSNA